MARYDLIPLIRIVLADAGAFPAVPARLAQAAVNGAASLWYLHTHLRTHAALSIFMDIYLRTHTAL